MMIVTAVIVGRRSIILFLGSFMLVQQEIGFKRVEIILFISMLTLKVG